MKIQDLFIFRNSSIDEAFKKIQESSFGLIVLVNKDFIFERTITDGDLRRYILTGKNLSSQLHELPHINSITVEENCTASHALRLMNKYYIDHIPVLNNNKIVVDFFLRKEIDKQILLSTPDLGESEEIFVKDAFDSNWIAPLGPNVDAFENELAEYIGIKHAAAVSSGTAAIHLALRVLGVKHGDIVFCSSLTFAASAFPILYQGAEPVFIDSDLDSWNMSPSCLNMALEIAKSKKKLPKALIVVNLYGQCADYDQIQQICDEYKIPIVEDAAESLGSFYKNRPSGTLGDISCFSFNGNKIITTSGGGMIVSNDTKLVQKAKFLSTQARENTVHYEHKELGYNYRMSNILAGIGRGQLIVLNDRVKKRINIFKNYKNELSSIKSIDFMPEPAWSKSNHWLSTMTIKPESGISSNLLLDYLAEKKIEARPIWKPMHLQPIFKKCTYYSMQGNDISKNIYNTGLCLPSGSSLRDDQQELIISSIKQFFKDYK